MSLSSSTLQTIQKAGAAAFTADEKLKQAAKHYADRVQAAMASNPYNLGNDALIENWKTVSRLSQTMAGIEAEIKKVFEVAADLIDEDQPIVVSTPLLAAPKRVAKKAAVLPVVKVSSTSAKSKSKKIKPANRAAKTASAAVLIDLAPTDVVVKTRKNTVKSKPKAKDKAPAPKAKVRPAKSTKAQPGELSGNNAKLMPQLERVLNATDFTVISQTAIAKEANIALGSMTAALKKLMELGRISTGPSGSYKLLQPATPAITTDAAGT
jgi:hypothetical protein